MPCVTSALLILRGRLGERTVTIVEPRDLPCVTARMSADTIVADAFERRPGDAVRFIWQDDEVHRVVRFTG